MDPSLPSVVKQDEDRAARKRRLYEGRREREFYSYYESVLSLFQTEPQLCDLNDPASVARHQAVSSPDKALTAFTQLVALKLQTRRSMLFFFDSDYAYVLAEATQTLSLQDDDRHQDGDELWLGSTKIPRGFSVCEVTADLPVVNDGSNGRHTDSKSIAHIINNLTEDTRFCDRPYVQDGPKARFYAGVPITTPKGINIGALCALDDKPRDGLNPAEIHFLCEMATTVMSHLELVRAKTDNQRSRDMTTSLGAYVEGQSQSEDWWHRGARRRSQDTRSKRASQASETKPGAESVPTDQANDELKNTEESTSRQDFALKDSHAAGNADTSGDQVSGEPEAKVMGAETAARSSRTAEQLQEDDLAAQIQLTTSRAAGLIREAVGADGVVFLDATIGSFGGLVSSSRGLSQSETETDGSWKSDITDSISSGRNGKHSSTSRTFRTEASQNSAILGSAYTPKAQTRLRVAVGQTQVGERFLRSLLRRYPKGQIWNFNQDGDASDDDASDASVSAASAGDSAGSDADLCPTPSSKRALKRSRARLKDAQAIQKAFPGVRCFAFLGMWESHRERWFGASILISYSPTRIFSISSELTYLAAFCDVVLAEVWRLEAQIVSRSKNDFISSISHELRSPLHGILGSAECLEDQDNSVLNQELIRSITSCGTTLLDIINDLLEYSRLNTGTQRRRKASHQSESSKESQAAERLDSRSNGECTSRLDVVTEDAVNASCLGFNHQGKALEVSSGSPPVTLTLDIESPSSPDWSFAIEAGAFKRICMNLTSNALKYTPSGHIRVSLGKKWLQRRGEEEGLDKALISLTVEDTGVGMSEAFQAQNLFKPFQQENGLVRGTGLGLNLVAQIVRSQGGTLDVRSKKGHGTSVTLLLPLRSAPLSPSAFADAAPTHQLPFAASAEFFGFDTQQPKSQDTWSNSHGDNQLIHSLKAYCRHLGLQDREPGASKNTTLYFIHEREVQKSSHEYGEKAVESTRISTASDSGLPLVVICSTRSSALRLRSVCHNTGRLKDAQFLWLPLGPAKLAAAISTCCRSRNLFASGSRKVDHSAVAFALENDRASTPEPHRESIDTLASVQSGAGAAKGSSQDAAPARENGGFSPPRDRSESKHQPDAVGDGWDHTTEGTSRLPFRPRASAQEPDDTSANSVTTTVGSDRGADVTDKTPDGGKLLSLLLVDDNRVNLRLLSIFAKKSGHIYRTAENGQEAVDMYQDTVTDETPTPPGDSFPPAPRPDVILMDINMPIMNGFEAARRIRQYERETHCNPATIVAVTGLGDTSAQEEAFASGMNVFLTKPVKLKELGAILAKIQIEDR